MKKILGLQKNIFLLGLTSLFNDFSSEMVLAVLPAFVTSVLKAGAASLGLIEGVANGASNLVNIAAGRLSDVLQRRKPFVVWGYVVSVLTRPIYFFASSVASVVGLRVTDRIGKGLRDGPRDAIISLSAEPHEVGRSFGYHRAMDTMGAILGPLTAYLILRHLPNGFHTVFLTAFVAGFLAIATTFFISDVVGQVKSKNLSLTSLARFPRPFRTYLLALFLLSVGSLPVAVMLLKTQSIGLMLASIPLFYMVFNLSYAGFSYPGGKWSDRVGPKRVIVVGYAILIVSYAALAFSKSVPALVVGFLILGLFPALTDGTQRAFAATLTEETDRGAAYGLINAVVGFGAIIAGVGGGFLWQAVGPLMAFIAGAVAVTLGLAILSPIGRRT